MILKEPEMQNCRKLKRVDKNSTFEIIENFADELVRNGIQKKKPKPIPDVWNGKARKGKHGII